ncbi:hypothetical protein Dimus_028722 [Dionaea muscipula]
MFQRRRKRRNQMMINACRKSSAIHGLGIDNEASADVPHICIPKKCCCYCCNNVDVELDVAVTMLKLGATFYRLSLL